MATMDFIDAGVVPPRKPPNPARYWWKFVHNGLVHPLMAIPWEPEWLDRLHQWTYEKWDEASR